MKLITGEESIVMAGDVDITGGSFHYCSDWLDKASEPHYRYLLRSSEDMEISAGPCAVLRVKVGFF